MPSNTQGFSLLEVLVCLTLLSIALFSLDAMEITALRQNRSIYFFSLAANQINNMAERLRALGNQPGLTEQVEKWNQENEMVLPSGKGEVRGGFPVYQLEIYWGGVKTCIDNTIGPKGCLREEIHVAV